MNRQRFILITLFMLPVYFCMDGFILFSVEIQSDVGIIDCKGLDLTIDGKKGDYLCKNGSQIEDHSYVIVSYNNGTNATTYSANATVWLSAEITQNLNETETLTYNGTFTFDTTSGPNKVLIGSAILNKNQSANYTVTSKTTTLTINYLHLKYNENPTVNKSNGGAVAVAIIEGIALIAILAYMGYRTMVKHRMKETTMNAAMYGYDNNSRITVPDSIRMSDIPPPRDPTYATPPTPTAQPTITPTRNTVMTTQELVVPTSAVSPTRPNTTTTTTNQQFRDPFDSLENW
ncbi:CBN-SID-2 protein [Caenorhabditis brenneri]|uniref:CBN-SID-2 protein n=1 Tax=Caenorhabditis brenneri TaxID=135651 RepID=G0ML34_CAEBE|nr:CBN-SID-2 protein [Caenorhabditis brenneri]